MGGGKGESGWGGGGGGGGGGGRVDVIEELKFLGKFTKKHTKKIGGGGGGDWVGRGGGSGWWGGQGGCERRIEGFKVFVKIQKKYFWGWVGGGSGWM